MDEVEVDCKAGTYPNLDDIVVEDDGPTLLLPCIVCNKTFKPEVLQRHSKVCEKNVHKKRKTFDSFKQRVQGTDLAEFLPFSTIQKKVSSSDKAISPKIPSSRWKENHEAFVSAIRAARGEGSDASGGSGDSRSVLRPPDHEQCPYCERHFGRKAFDRHQDWCREQHSRQPPVTASIQAKERLEARIKYRAPPIKSKRAITREKYSPLVQRKVRQVSPSSSSNFSSTTGSATSSAGSSRHTPQSQQEQSNRLSKSGNISGRSQPKDSASSLGFNRGTAGRTSLRSSQRTAARPSSPTKSSTGSGKLPASPILRRTTEDSRRVHDKDDMAVTSASLRKLQSRNPPIKHESKILDTPKMTAEKKLDESCAPAANTPTLHIEINTKQLKDNTNNSKSAKNDQLWRQGCAKHTGLLSLLPNPPSPAVPSPVTPRGLIREKEARRNCLFRCKTNRIDVNSHVAEMVVTPLCTRYGPCGESRHLKPTNNFHARVNPVWGGKLCHAEATSIPGITDCDSESTISLKLSSSSETPDYSPSSADSNRTYVTQSSVCFKIDNLQDIDCHQMGKTSPEPTLKSSCTNIKSDVQKISKVIGFPECTQSLSDPQESICKTLKRPTYQDFPHTSSDFSDREKLIPRKRVKSSKRSKKAAIDHHASKLSAISAPLPPVAPKQSRLLCHAIEKSVAFSDTHCNSGIKKRDICTSPENLSICPGVGSSSHRTTWLDIAKCGNRTSQYVSFYTHSNVNQFDTNLKIPNTYVDKEWEISTSVTKNSSDTSKVLSTSICYIKTDKKDLDTEAKKPLNGEEMHFPKLVLMSGKNISQQSTDCSVYRYTVPEKAFTKPPFVIRNHSSVKLQPLPLRKSLRYWQGRGSKSNFSF